MLYVMNTVEESIVDGEGIRSVVFVAGCSHRCGGCHNPLSWDRNNGNLMSIEEVYEMLTRNPLTDITFSGGEPFNQSVSLSHLATMITDKSIWCYTGYLFEDLVGNPRFDMLLNKLDVLVDGKFDINKTNPDLIFKGSENQRIIDVQKSLIEGKVVLYEGGLI